MCIIDGRENRGQACRLGRSAASSPPQNNQLSVGLKVIDNSSLPARYQITLRFNGRVRDTSCFALSTRINMGVRNPARVSTLRLRRRLSALAVYCTQPYGFACQPLRGLVHASAARGIIVCRILSDFVTYKKNPSVKPGRYIFLSNYNSLFFCCFRIVNFLYTSLCFLLICTKITCRLCRLGSTLKLIISFVILFHHHGNSNNLIASLLKEILPIQKLTVNSIFLAIHMVIALNI